MRKVVWLLEIPGRNANPPKWLGVETSEILTLHDGIQTKTRITYVENAYNAIKFADKESAENTIHLLSEGHRGSEWIATQHVFENEVKKNDI